MNHVAGILDAFGEIKYHNQEILTNRPDLFADRFYHVGIAIYPTTTKRLCRRLKKHHSQL